MPATPEINRLYISRGENQRFHTVVEVEGERRVAYFNAEPTNGHIESREAITVRLENETRTIFLERKGAKVRLTRK